MLRPASTRRLPPIHPVEVPSGVCLFWDFSDTGNLLIDGSGNGHHGAVTGAIVQAGPTGLVRSFDGIDDGVLSVDSVPFNASAWTLSAWLCLRDVDTWQLLMGWNFGLHPEIACEAGGVAVYYADTLAAYSPDTVFALNEWVHVAVTWTTGGRHSIYANGASLSLGLNDAPEYFSESAPFYVSNPNNRVNGLIGEVFAANRAMTAPEIESHYRETSWRYVG